MINRHSFSLSKQSFSLNKQSFSIHKEVNKPAGFLIRLLANLIDNFLFALTFSLAIFFLAGSQTLAQLVFGFLLYLLTLGLPLLILGIFYPSYFTHRFGGTIGKLVTGLKVTDLNGHLLTLRRSLFRHTLGYSLSSILFLGFLSIIKDPEKRGFHDKATPSKVTVVKNLWPIGLVILIVLILAHLILWTNIIQKFGNSPLRSEFGFLILNLNQQLEKKEPLNELPESSMNEDGSTLLNNNPSSAFNKQLDQIYILLEEKNYPEAQTQAEQLEKDTQNPIEKAQVNVALADIAYTQNKIPEAKKFALAAIAMDSLNPDAHQLMAEIEIANRNYDSALTYAQTALKLDSNDPVNHNDLGVALYGLGRVDEAIIQVKKAIEISPSNPNFQENLKIMEQGR